MFHKVYMRDWYFNSGIIGFLLTLFPDNEDDIKTNENLKIGDNYIEFNPEILEGFEEKFKKIVFLGFFKFESKRFINKINFILKEYEKDKIKFNIKKQIDDKSTLKKFFDAMDFELDIEQLGKIKEDIEQFSAEKIYTMLLEKNKDNYIKDFITLKSKGIFSVANINSLMESINKIDSEKKLKPNDCCLSCQERKSEIEFNNAISNVIGFNKDNSNWIWGFNSSKIKLCSVCALIYTCAFISFAQQIIKDGKDYINYFYFLNYNTNLEELYKEIKSFKLLLEKNESENDKKPFILLIKETIKLIKEQQIKKIQENINFIEVIENPILGGQSSKGYNVFNYNIDKDLANFLSRWIDKIPSGYYKIKDTSFNIDEELLKLTIERKLSYQNLNNYFSIYISGSIKYKKFSISFISKFILDYINYFMGGSMETKEKIINKAFRNGKELREVLKGVKKENQISGLVYSLLNDLKISDREKFLDKYIRLMMSNKLDMKFAKEEMGNIDSFLQFGYSFINGLLYEEYKSENNKEEAK